MMGGKGLNVQKCCVLVMNQYRSGEQYDYIQISGYSSDDGSCYQFSNLEQKYQLRTST